MKPYACNNAPRFRIGQPVKVQSGWEFSGRRKLITVPHFSTDNDCKYDAQETDKRCKGCVHIKKEKEA